MSNPFQKERDALAAEVKQVRGRLKAAEKDLKRREEKEVSAASLRKTLYGLSEIVPAPPKWINQKPKKGQPNVSVPVAMWSDWHAGEVVRPSEVGGLNKFNNEICRARIKRLVNITIELAKKHMGKVEYPGIVICLGGDMVSGNIHEELRETNDGTINQMLLWLQDDIAAALTRMADEFGKVFVPCVVGNHGRMKMKPHAKRRAFENYEWSLYQQLERHFKGDDRVQFYIPDGPDAMFNVLGHRILLTHGDTLGVKGGDGIIGAIGPIARGAVKIGRSEAQVGRDFDTLMLGHWHTYIPRGEASPVAVNGTLKGFDEFAHTILRVPYSRPSQSLMFIHGEHGITAQWQVFLEGRAKAKPLKDWVCFNDI
jgi:predicted phosphodiesterase